MSVSERRALLAAAEDPEFAGRCLRELPVDPEDGEATVADVARAVTELDPAPLYEAAGYANRVAETSPRLLVEHPALVETLLRSGVVNDDNYVREATAPVRALAAVDPELAAPFVDALVSMLDHEPSGHEGATEILRTLRHVQFGDETVARAATEPAVLSHPEAGGCARRLVEHSASVAAVLARQHSPDVHHTASTVEEALLVLHGIAVTEPAAVADDYHLRQVVRVLRESSPTTRRYHEACGLLAAVATAQPEAVAPHVDAVVSDTAARIREAVHRQAASEGTVARGRRPRAAVAGVQVVTELAETHPEATVEAARWAGLRRAVNGVGEAAAMVVGPVLDAAESTDHAAVRALCLRLVATLAGERAWEPAIADEILDRTVALVAASDEHTVDAAASEVHRVVEETRADSEA